MKKKNSCFIVCIISMFAGCSVCRRRTDRSAAGNRVHGRGYIRCGNDVVAGQHNGCKVLCIE